MVLITGHVLGTSTTDLILFVAAGLVAVAVWTPYLLWQADHGWPQRGMASALRAQGAQGGSLGLLVFQVVVGPLLLPLCVVGLVWLGAAASTASSR